MSPGRARRAAAAAGFLLLAAGLVSPLSPRAVRARVAIALSAGVPADVSFDPAFRDFLVDVERATPPDATVALFAPRGELYVYLAAYRLAPRRVLIGANACCPSAVGVFGPAVGFAPPGPFERRAVSHGTLFLRRR
jgi:hypothetical protein